MITTKPLEEVGDILEGGMNLVDELHTSQEEELSLLQNIHAADMKSDSWLSKNIRPMFLVFACVGWLACMIVSANGIEIDEQIIVVLERWGELAAVFFFGSRGWEKVEKTKMKREIVKSKVIAKEARIARKDKKLEDKLEKRRKRREDK